MSQPTTAVLAIDKIEVEDGLNPRTRFDEDRLAELEASIRQDGLVTALTVVPAKDGHFTVIAGERRLIAAKRAGLQEVPAVVRAVKGSRAATLVENLIREDLDPIDTAQGLADLAEAENLTTHQQLAERIGKKKNVGWVSDHLRLLRLPEGVQRYIAAGDVPVAAEKELRGVAEISPRIAECICELAKRNKVKGRDFVNRFDELFSAAGRARFDDKPTMIDPSTVRLSKVVADAKQQQELRGRYKAACPHDPSDDPEIRLVEAEVDAARAAGCLVEHEVDHGEWVSTTAFITDLELAADLAERAVDRIEKEAEERAKRQEELGANGHGSALTPEQKEVRREQRQEAEAMKVEARRFNEALGRKLLERRGGAGRKQHALARVKVLAEVVLADNGRLAARGLRLVVPQLQDVKVKKLKSGESRERVSYADPKQCAEFLAKRVEDAGSVNEVLEILADAMIAAELADEDALPQSKRVYGGIRALSVEKRLTADIKEVRPRRRRRKAA